MIFKSSLNSRIAFRVYRVTMPSPYTGQRTVYEVHPDAKVYRFRPDGAMRRCSGKEELRVQEEVKRREDRSRWTKFWSRVYHVGRRALSWRW